MSRDYEKLDKKIFIISKKIKEYPKGKLVCCSTGKYTKWYNSNGKTRTYIPKKEIEVAKKLAEKQFYDYQLRDLLEEKQALDKSIKAFSKLQKRADGLWEKRGYKELLCDFYKPEDKIIEEWINEGKKDTVMYQDGLKFRATQNKMVRSKSEVIIDKLLYEHKIPFCYERLLQLDGSIYYPDFTIMHPKTKKIYYWEHFGRMDDNDYIKRTYRKLQIYAEHGIIETVNLIATYETLDNPLVLEDVEEIIIKYFL